jgi:hypothetical protein
MANRRRAIFRDAGRSSSATKHRAPKPPDRRGRQPARAQGRDEPHGDGPNRTRVRAGRIVVGSVRRFRITARAGAQLHDARWPHHVVMVLFGRSKHFTRGREKQGREQEPARSPTTWPRPLLSWGARSRRAARYCPPVVLRARLTFSQSYRGEQVGEIWSVSSHAGGQPGGGSR